jgi:hypothetical protein
MNIGTYRRIIENIGTEQFLGGTTTINERVSWLKGGVGREDPCHVVTLPLKLSILQGCHPSISSEKRGSSEGVLVAFQ